MGQVASWVIGSISRKLVQPLVLQYGRPAAWLRRRMRRIAADRPATLVEVVRDIMGLSVRFFPARASRGRRRWSSPLALVAALRP
jgi:hypothetical protein